MDLPQPPQPQGLTRVNVIRNGMQGFTPTIEGDPILLTEQQLAQRPVLFMPTTAPDISNDTIFKYLEIMSKFESRQRHLVERIDYASGQGTMTQLVGVQKLTEDSCEAWCTRRLVLHELILY